MTPMEAIVSATSDSARSCWWQDQVGSLEPGKEADVLVVRYNKPGTMRLAHSTEVTRPAAWPPVPPSPSSRRPGARRR